jgi:hypothetical protein
MQEFSSVTASSYDAESLAPLLNERAADGWSVVSIVAAGTNIVAYLQRETDGAPAAETPAVETPVEESPTIDEPATDAPFVPAAAAVAAAEVVEEAPAAVDEPAGWATAPAEAEEVAADTTDSSIADLAAQVSEPEPEPEPAVAEPAAEAAPAVESTVPAGWYADPSGRFELRYWDGTAWTEHVSRAGQQFTDPPVA